MTSEFAIAVHALVYLNHRQQTVSSEALASTKEGLEGGYHFEKDSSCVNLRQVCDALEVDFVSASWKSGDKEMDCMIASGMAAIMDEIYADLDELCRKRLESITIASIEAKIFKS